MTSVTAGETRFAHPAFEVRGLEVALGGCPVLGPLDLSVPRDAFLGILGPNGSGKTTLLRTLTGSVAPSAGLTLLENRAIREYRAAELARLVGVVPQQFQLDFAFTVREMVGMGRYAHAGVHGHGRHDDGPTADAAVDDALTRTGLVDLADRLVTQLSGGERQRALIAQTLAQQTPILLLDEPLNNLDLNHQLEIMQLLTKLHEEGRTIAVVLHDLNMAAQYCQELVLLSRGRIAARGEPAQILDPRLILDVFRVRVAVHREGRRPYVTPLWSRARTALRAEPPAKIHVIAGGGAASELLEELVLRGMTPSLGVVSVFDTDYTTAQRYELEVVSAPPFQRFPADTLRQLEALLSEAEVIVVAPTFFGLGNLDPLRMTLAVCNQDARVIIMNQPPIQERDLTGGEAERLLADLVTRGAVLTTGTAGQVADEVSRLAGC